MEKSPIITVSRQQVEADIQREIDQGASRVEAAYRVMGNAARGIKEASEQINAMVREAGGFDKLAGEPKAKYENLCRTVIEPENQRIGHCKNIIWELTKPT